MPRNASIPFFPERLRRLGAPLLVALTLALAPLASGSAVAKDGGHSGSGSSGSGSSGGHGGSGSSGSGSSGGGSSGGHGESGSSGSGHGEDHSGSGKGGSDSGGSGRGRSGTDDGGKKESRSGRVAGSHARLDRVVWSARREGAIEVRYADGWSEKVDNSGYTLRDPGRRVVASRPAKPSDFSRLGAIAE